jgi:3-oxoacyl-(acyl-carrier-protein) synthase
VLGPDVPVVSTKSYTGHLLGAAGGVEAVLTLLSITEGFLPASLRCHPVDPDIAAHISTTRRTGRIRRALSNSFAFGGSNVSVLLGEPR